MNIVLIYPFFFIDRAQDENVEVPPIGLHYLGALLTEQGHEVELLNWYDGNNRQHLIQEALVTLKPDVIGFSIFHANLARVLANTLVRLGREVEARDLMRNRQNRKA